jgi:hypothetical protein
MFYLKDTILNISNYYVFILYIMDYSYSNDDKDEDSFYSGDDDKKPIEKIFVNGKIINSLSDFINRLSDLKNKLRGATRLISENDILEVKILKKYSYVFSNEMNNMIYNKNPIYDTNLVFFAYTIFVSIRDNDKNPNLFYVFLDIMINEGFVKFVNGKFNEFIMKPSDNFNVNIFQDDVISDIINYGNSSSINRDNCIGYMLDKGLDPNFKVFGYEPLIHHVLNNYSKFPTDSYLIEKILYYGADINIIYWNTSPICQAIGTNGDIIDLFLKRLYCDNKQKLILNKKIYESMLKKFTIMSNDTNEQYYQIKVATKLIKFTKIYVNGGEFTSPPIFKYIYEKNIVSFKNSVNDNINVINNKNTSNKKFLELNNLPYAETVLELVIQMKQQNMIDFLVEKTKDYTVENIFMRNKNIIGNTLYQNIIYDDVLHTMLFGLEIECCIPNIYIRIAKKITENNDFPKMINNENYSPMHFNTKTIPTGKKMKTWIETTDGSVVCGEQNTKDCEYISPTYYMGNKEKYYRYSSSYKYNLHANHNFDSKNKDTDENYHEGIDFLSNQYDNLFDKMGYYINDSCGLHIHLSNGILDSSIMDKKIIFNILVRFAQLWWILEPILMSFIAEHRNNNKYCIKLRERYNNYTDLYHLILFPEKSYSVNFRYSKSDKKGEYNTHIEIRIHHATKDKDEVINWILLLNKIYSMCIYLCLSKPITFFDNVLNYMNSIQDKQQIFNYLFDNFIINDRLKNYYSNKFSNRQFGGKNKLGELKQTSFIPKNLFNYENMKIDESIKKYMNIIKNINIDEIKNVNPIRMYYDQDFFSITPFGKKYLGKDTDVKKLKDNIKEAVSKSATEENFRIVFDSICCFFAKYRYTNVDILKIDVNNNKIIQHLHMYMNENTAIKPLQYNNKNKYIENKNKYSSLIKSEKIISRRNKNHKNKHYLDDD